MKRTIKILALALVFGAYSSVSAQSNEKAPKTEKENVDSKGKKGQKKLTPEQIAEKQTKRMTNQLSLTESQKQPVYDIMLERVKQRAVDREACKGEKECASAAMRKRNMRADEKLKATLSPEQYEKLKSLRAAAKENKGKGKGGAAPKPVKFENNGAPDAEEKE